MRLSDCSVSAIAPPQPLTHSPVMSGQYLSFNLGQERYAVDILNVQEIRRFDTVTLVPDSPDYIKGVINLRGVIVPVMDLRLKLNMPAAQHDHFTVMIVLTIGARVIGIVVDSVCDVIELKRESILPPPQFSDGVHSSLICGISTLDETMVIVLDSERLTANEDAEHCTIKPSHINNTADELDLAA